MQDDLVTKKLSSLNEKIDSAYIDITILIGLLVNDVITNESFILIDELKEIKQKLRQIYKDIKQLQETNFYG